MNVEDVVGGVYLPNDGIVNPVDVTQALAKGARKSGAQILENVRVLDVKVRNGKACGVVTDRGDVDSEYVVNCAGMWARHLARRSGVSLPLHAAEHYYVVTEPMPALPALLPTLRDLDSCNYFKTDARKLLIGTFEPDARPWGHEGIPETFSFEQLAPDLSHLEPYLDAAMRRVPALRDTGLKLIFNGPESFTPESRWYRSRRHGNAPGWGFLHGGHRSYQPDTRLALAQAQHAR